MGKRQRGRDIGEETEAESETEEIKEERHTGDGGKETEGNR
jgi:hypothetical protein